MRGTWGGAGLSVLLGSAGESRLPQAPRRHSSGNLCVRFAHSSLRGSPLYMEPNSCQLQLLLSAALSTRPRSRSFLTFAFLVALAELISPPHSTRPYQREGHPWPCDPARPGEAAGAAIQSYRSRGMAWQVQRSQPRGQRAHSALGNNTQSPTEGQSGPGRGGRRRRGGGRSREEGEGRKQVFSKPGTPWNTLWRRHRLLVWIPEARGLSC